MSAEGCFNGINKTIQFFICPETVLYEAGSDKAKWATNARLVSGIALGAIGVGLLVLGAILDSTVFGCPAGAILGTIGVSTLFAGALVLTPILWSAYYAELLT